ncbi:MAG: ribosomal RNA small subunit methyltransferase A [Candidatus Diapherotrites archaeon]|nr:ribosomal RNA small subunit methyltransferase A [Candidatus Diapherotrites archaeon]
MNLLTEAAYFLQTSARHRDQHFLVNEELLHREAGYAQLTKSDVVLEVGGGLGFLTRELVKHCKTIVVEKDIRFIGTLQKLGAEVIHGNALKIGFPEFTKFVSNIPYSISLPLTLKLLRTDFKLGVIIAQKEFAKKLAAKPGSNEYGRASVIAQYYADIELLDKVRKSDFEPKPKVESRVVFFRKRRGEDRGFEGFATSLFRHRRKKAAGTDKRPEQLTIDDFIRLYKQQKS